MIREPQLLTFEHGAVLIAENRNQDFVGELVFDRVPLDVEEMRKPGARPVLEHVLPPPVGRLRNAHVVRHEIEDVPHVVRAKRADPFAVFRVGADVRIERRGIGDVVAVRAARDRFQIG